MTEREKRAQYMQLAGIVLLLAVVIFLVFIFMRKNSERIFNENQRYLEDATQQSIKNMDNIFSNAFDSIAIVANLYELQIDGDTVNYTLLDEMTETTAFDYVRFVDKNGIAYSSDGEKAQADDREYYVEGMKGRSGVCYVAESRLLMKPALHFYTPLYHNGEIIGVVYGAHDLENLANDMATEFFGVSAHEYLCLRDGTVIACSGVEASPHNIFSYLEQGGMISAQTMESIMRFAEDGETLSFKFTDADGEGNGFASMLSDHDFVLVKTFPSSITNSMTERANKTAVDLSIALALTFFAYIFCATAYHVRRNKRLAKENDSLSSIVDAVKRLYRCFIVIDLEQDSYVYLTEFGLPELGVPDSGSYSQWSDTVNMLREKHSELWDGPELPDGEQLKTELTRENWYMQFEYPTPGGRWERLSLIKIDMEQDDTSRVLGAVEDITTFREEDMAKRQALVEAFKTAEAASTAKSDFLSRMSHDIRTPMNAIIGLTAIMGTHLDDRDRMIDCLAKISNSSKHLLGLINEVLDLSKIESGKLSLTEADFNLSEMVDELLNIVQPMVNAKNQELDINVQGIQHENVIGDSSRFERVCVNILSNAVKYTDEGGKIILTIRELNSRQPLLGQYEFAIEDNGIGMSPEFLERLFQPFERAEDERVGKTQGTGLGMSIAQNIVRLMGGTITVESELGHGSKFTVHVPFRLSDIEDIEEDGRLAGLPILVADDDRICCESACLVLEELGMQGEWVLSGRQAVERVKEHHSRGEDFFAVILDWKMPGMDGVETTRNIRREVGPDVPIIILSSYDWSEIESEARHAGADGFVSKPLFKSKLRGVLTRLMDKSQPELIDQLESIQQNDYTGRRVLLVEDNEINQEIAAEILEMSNLTVELAENGRVALERFAASEEGYYDMVFMDVQMPVMNGYEATRAIRALDRVDAGKVPIVAMTANTFNEDVQAALDAGMNQHIAKPLDIEQLNQTLHRWLV